MTGLLHHCLGHDRVWLNEMKMGANSMYQRAEYTEVVEPERLVCLMSTTDANWQIATNPRMPDWPRTLSTTVTFEQIGKRTKVRLTWVPHNATAVEIACFSAAIAGLDKGWGAGMELLAKILAELQAL